MGRASIHRRNANAEPLGVTRAVGGASGAAHSKPKEWGGLRVSLTRHATLPDEGQLLTKQLPERLGIARSLGVDIVVEVGIHRHPALPAEIGRASCRERV